MTWIVDNIYWIIGFCILLFVLWKAMWWFFKNRTRDDPQAQKEINRLQQSAEEKIKKPFR